MVRLVVAEHDQCHPVSFLKLTETEMLTGDSDRALALSKAVAGDRLCRPYH